MPLALPPYNPEARCPKCGHDLVGTRYVRGETFDFGSLPGSKVYIPEYLERTCVRCGHSWQEAVLE